MVYTILNNNTFTRVQTMEDTLNLAELEWKVGYLNGSLSLAEQIVENEPQLSEEEREYFDWEMAFLREWIKDLEEYLETIQINREISSSHDKKEFKTRKLNDKIKFLKQERENVKNSIALNKHLPREEMEFLEEDLQYIKKWIKELEVRT